MMSSLREGVHQKMTDGGDGIDKKVKDKKNVKIKARKYFNQSSLPGFTTIKAHWKMKMKKLK